MKSAGHKVLITGGASGIGLALTEQFVREGNKVIVVGRDRNKLDAVRAQFPGIVVYVCDLRSTEETEALAARLTAEHPDLSVLVNNAGMQYEESFLDPRDDRIGERISEEIGLNLVSPIRLTAKLLPILALRAEAAIVNVSSGLAISPKKSAPVYCATKAGIHLFTQSIRYQLESTNIRVFEIIPPLVDTEMTRGRGGRRKLPPGELARQFWRAYRRDRLEVPIGKVKLLKLMKRLVPSAADALLKNG
ncbi:putative oxidoreductase DltE [Paenibacillus sp. CCS19]|uniref:SDR family oxidoreductase n=1 Tax=Paenibacillus sp. CCS19 TaxID=3158387 RepID=UPI00255EC434|nr:SDR family NAD(P)-dependent oxidoreductase [Paenibacillus cellulosilyticus]GMK39315.1 putative oxidoreductase DltE [Paenibacillus cellulosilyticus]